jgi:hypothetical protein
MNNFSLVGQQLTQTPDPVSMAPNEFTVLINRHRGFNGSIEMVN